MTSVNGIPGDGSTAGGAGPAPGRARRQPATPITQTQRGGGRKPAQEAAADRDQATVLAVEQDGYAPPLPTSPAQPGAVPADGAGAAPAAPDGHAPATADGHAPATAAAAARPAAPEPLNVRVIGPATAATASAPVPAASPASPAPAQAAPPVPVRTAQRPGAGPATAGAPARPADVRARPSAELFARHTRAYLADSPGPSTILQAGATTAADLGTGSLPAGHFDIMVSQIDEDEPVTREAVARHASLSDCALGDLRTVPLSPRAFDIVQCGSLLERIQHAELVLDRLIGAIKPGGLLLLRIRDRDSAAGFLDRNLPDLVRRAIWRKRRPGEPGPYPAVYEPLASARGVQAYALLRGLVIAERQALGGLAGGLPAGPHGFLAAQKLAASMSRGRYTAAHEEMLYVLRKPESRFARVL